MISLVGMANAMSAVSELPKDLMWLDPSVKIHKQLLWQKRPLAVLHVC